jgi:hypothetical protein
MTDKDDPQMRDRVIQWWEDPNQDHTNARSMGADLLNWVLTHYPHWINMKVNQEWFDKRIEEMEARGETVLPDTFPGIRITRKFRGQSIDEN